MTNATALLIGSIYGYFAYMSAIAAQDVWTTCVLSCSTHAQASHVCPQIELRPNKFGMNDTPYSSHPSHRPLSQDITVDVVWTDDLGTHTVELKSKMVN